jgi:hypothetical protein
MEEFLDELESSDEAYKRRQAQRLAANKERREHRKEYLLGRCGTLADDVFRLSLSCSLSTGA